MERPRSPTTSSRGRAGFEAGYPSTVLRFGLQAMPGLSPIKVSWSRTALGIWPQDCA